MSDILKYTTLPYQPSFYMNLKQGSDDWKERRKDFPVTGSQIASVFNLSAYNRSAKKLYQNKKNNTEEKFSRYQTEVIFGHEERTNCRSTVLALVSTGVSRQESMDSGRVRDKHVQVQGKGLLFWSISGQDHCR